MKSRTIVLIAIAISSCVVLGAAHDKSDQNISMANTSTRDTVVIDETLNSGNVIAEVDAYIETVQKDYGIPGIALAIIKEGEIVHKKYYGYASLEHEAPVHAETSFCMYSLTKPIIATAVYRLQENGKLRVTDKISKYLNNIPDPWKKVRIVHLLAQTSGLPDMFGKNPVEFRDLNEKEAESRVYNLPMCFNPGDRFDYVQTNSWLLKRIIEKVTGDELERYILNTQFPNQDGTQVYFSNDARDIIKHRATSYFPWLKEGLAIDLPYTNGDYLSAAKDLHLTLDAMIEWDKRFNSAEIISRESIKAMQSAYPYDRDDELFAQGWGLYGVNGRLTYGFSGSMSTIYRIFPDTNTSVIFFSNGFTSFYGQNDLIEKIHAITKS